MSVSTPVNGVLEAYERGYSAQLVVGRSLYDLVADDEGRILTILEHLRREARARKGMHLITYSLSRGVDWDDARVQNPRDRSTIEGVLGRQGLLGLPIDNHEVVRAMRGITSLARSRSDKLYWADGAPMRFVILLEFAEHLTPSGQNGGRTEQEIMAVELAHVLGQSGALRQSSNLVILHGREGHLDQLVAEALHPIRLAQPDAAEKTEFVRAARRLHPSARIEGDLSDGIVAGLSANTPNRSIEALLRASGRGGAPVTIGEILARKRDDVVALSEGTLSVLDTRRVSGLVLVGRNVAVPQAMLRSFGLGILQGNPHVPANILLIGPPGTGKTDLALSVAQEGKASAYQVHSPKGGIVGETERRATLLTRALSDWTPNVAFADEITEMLPTERTGFDGDSGSSRAVIAALLTALSDESRRGKSIFIGTTNCPWRMGTALRSRFTMMPVLSPVAEDFPQIVAAVVGRLAPTAGLGPSVLAEAGRVFFEKGASPREILAAVSLALALGAPADAETVLEAAMDLCAQSDRASTQYADLWAVKACGSQRFLPWHRRADDFPFPTHLDGLVDRRTGTIDHQELDRRIKALQSAVNL